MNPKPVLKLVIDVYMKDNGVPVLHSVIDEGDGVSTVCYAMLNMELDNIKYRLQSSYVPDVETEEGGDEGTD